MLKKILSATLLAAAFALPVHAADKLNASVPAEITVEMERLIQIGASIWPLKEANVALCGNAVEPAIGISPGGSLNNMPLALGIAEGSPAYLAGLRDFDELVSINGKKLKSRTLQQVLDRYNEVLEDQAEVGAEMTVNFIRDGVEGVAKVTPVLACSSSVLYVPKPIPSTTQGTTVLQGNAIDAYAETPEQIRAYLSRSLARIVLDHQGQNQREGRMLGLLGKAADLMTGHRIGATGNALARFRNGPAQDLEQDYLSVFLLARTGDDVTGIADFWAAVFENMTGNALIGRAMGQSQGSPERLQKLVEARDEVLALQQAGAPLVPSERGESDT